MLKCRQGRLATLKDGDSDVWRKIGQLEAPFDFAELDAFSRCEICQAGYLSSLQPRSHQVRLGQSIDKQAVRLTSACANTTAWWEELTGGGGEGMVVKPRGFITRGKKGMTQPALKVRGREYLRIIYGPEYDAPGNLSRLRERGLNGKRNLAVREFALGHEGLKRFVAREPLRRIHECVFGVLALESEPIDPRL